MNALPKKIPFKDLSISTATIMAYANISFDLMNLFKNMHVTIIDPPLTKKKKNIDKKKLTAPYGAIVGLQHGVYIRGIRTSKRKKYWCPVCQLFEVRADGEDHKILTVVEYVEYVPKKECKALGFPIGTQKIHFICGECEREFELKQLCKIVSFLNQVTIVLALDNIMVNIMMFKDNFKIAGNKKVHDATEAIMILWENYISDLTKYWFYRDSQSTSKDVHFLFDFVMGNVDFQLGFPIDKKKMNYLMNQPQYKNVVKMSQYESTSATHVNIKMYTERASDFKYDVLVYEHAQNTNPYFSQMATNPYARKKRSEEKFITIICFSSSKTIVTGRYFEDMEKKYNFFVEEAYKNRDKIEEKISKPNKSIHDHLKTIKI